MCAHRHLPNDCQSDSITSYIIYGNCWKCKDFDEGCDLIDFHLKIWACTSVLVDACGFGIKRN